ncbi:hypothetical protein FS837_007273 [Tulasnella sp. UAMH 9824]|nr:hypothetical protein FS837_007273 [Tulasnella sp. UAMH 9824]
MTTPPPPPLPLRDEIEKLVFTHKSLYPKPTNVIDDIEDPKDWERIAFLGEGILLAAASRVLYYAYPKRRTNSLNPTRTQMIGKEALASTTDAYRFTDRMKCLEANRAGIAMSTDTRAALAESFVGGLALEYGVGVATKWAAEVLAWKHGLPVPPTDEQRLGQAFVTGAVPTSSPPPASHPAAVSPAPPPGPGPAYVRPARSIAPRPEHPQIRPPQEVPVPATEYDPPYPQYAYAHQPTFQGASSYPQMPGMIMATLPTTYNPAPVYPRPSARPQPQVVPYTQAPSSPPAAAQFPQQAAQQVDYRNFGQNSPPTAPPSFAESVGYQQPPPQAAAPQPQLQAATNNIPVWGPQVPGAGAIPYGAPSPSGPRAILDME